MPAAGSICTCRCARTRTDPIEPGDAFSTAVFHALTFAEEESLLSELRVWNRLRAERGYHAIAAPVEDGGLGLSREHDRAYARLETRVRDARAP